MRNVLDVEDSEKEERQLKKRSKFLKSLPEIAFKDPVVQNFASRLDEPNGPKPEKKKYFIYQLDTSKRYFVDELPNVAVE